MQYNPTQNPHPFRCETRLSALFFRYYMVYTIMARLDFLCDRCGGEKNKIIDMRELNVDESDETWARILREDGHNMICITCADAIDTTLLLVDLENKIDRILKGANISTSKQHRSERNNYDLKKGVGEFTEKDEKD